MAARKQPDAAGGPVGDVTQLITLLDQTAMRGRGRHSQLSRWLRAHHDAFVAMLADRQPGWDDLATALAALGLRDGDGKPPTGERARKAWWAVRRAKATASQVKPPAPPGPAGAITAAPQPETPPAIRPATPSPDRPVAQRQSPTCDPPDAPSILPAAEKNVSPFADQDPPTLEIRPVRMRGGTRPLPILAKDAKESMASLLSDEEVARRTADLAERQGGQKIAAAKVID
jgi:hypothetical protein